MAFMKTITDCPFTFSFPEGFLEQWESEHPNGIPFSIELPPQPEEQPGPEPAPEDPPNKRETEIVELPASGGQSDSEWEPNEEEEEDDEEYEYPKQNIRNEKGARAKKRRKRPQPYRKRETRRNKRRRTPSKTQNKKRPHPKTTSESLDRTLPSLQSFSDIPFSGEGTATGRGHNWDQAMKGLDIAALQASKWWWFLQAEKTRVVGEQPPATGTGANVGSLTTGSVPEQEENTMTSKKLPPRSRLKGVLAWLHEKN